MEYVFSVPGLGPFCSGWFSMIINASIRPKTERLGSYSSKKEPDPLLSTLNTYWMLVHSQKVTDR